MSPPQKQIQQDDDKQNTSLHQPANHRVADSDEHDAKASKNASNADLKKQAAVVKKAHQAADMSSFKTASDALDALARAFTEWGVTLDSSQPDAPITEYITKEALATITHIFTTAAREAQTVLELKSKADPTDKRTLGQSALTCRGAFKRFASKADAASNWASKFEGHPKNPIATMQPIVDTYTTDTSADGAAPTALDAPGNARTMRGNVIEDLMKNISADVASAKLGNADDAKRIITHVRALTNYSKPEDPKMGMDPAVTKHKPELKALEASITTLMAETKNSDLSEAILALQGLTK